MQSTLCAFLLVDPGFPCVFVGLLKDYERDERPRTHIPEVSSCLDRGVADPRSRARGPRTGGSVPELALSQKVSGNADKTRFEVWWFGPSPPWGQQGQDQCVDPAPLQAVLGSAGCVQQVSRSGSYFIFLLEDRQRGKMKEY